MKAPSVDAMATAAEWLDCYGEEGVEDENTDHCKEVARWLDRLIENKRLAVGAKALGVSTKKFKSLVALERKLHASRSR